MHTYINSEELGTVEEAIEKYYKPKKGEEPVLEPFCGDLCNHKYTLPVTYLIN
jgi:hypothetical protein